VPGKKRESRISFINGKGRGKGVFFPPLVGTRQRGGRKKGKKLCLRGLAFQWATDEGRKRERGRGQTVRLLEGGGGKKEPGPGHHWRPSGKRGPILVQKKKKQKIGPAAKRAWKGGKN